MRGETLIIHHVEPMWEKSIEVVEPILRHLERATYDQVILTTMEGYANDIWDAMKGYYWSYSEHAPYRIVDWSYAWESSPEQSAEYFNLPVEDFIYVSTPHDVAYVYPWIKELKGKLKVCGGFRSECLQDLLETLDHLNKSYKTIDRLIYG